MPRVSIIVPVYKVEKYLKQCIDSLVAQTCQDIEIILINDGSPDKCGEICEEYAAKHPVVKVIHQENQGVSVARNTGIAEANGEWLMFVDGDDWIEPDMVERMLGAVGDTVSELCICGLFEETSSETIARHNHIEALKKGGGSALMKAFFSFPVHNWLSGPMAKLYRKEYVTKNQIVFPVGIKRGEDAVFNLYAFQLAANPAYCAAPLYHYRQWEDSAVHKYDPDAIEDKEKRCGEIKKFALQHPNGGLSLRFYNAVVIIALAEIAVASFAHRDCPLSFREKRRQLCKLTAREPYKSALRDVKLGELVLKQRVGAVLLKCRQMMGYYLLCKLRHGIKRKKAKIV